MEEIILKQKIGIFVGPGLFFLVLIFITPQGMNQESRAILASTLWIATWWISEAVPIPVTSLLPIVLFPLTKGLDIGKTTAAYGHPIIFLFIGGFILALAIERWELHRRIALNIIKAMGTDGSKIILGFMIASALLSMWISNTAASLMMMPIGLAIISHFTENLKSKNKGFRPFDFPFGKALMLSIAYSASIGGMATIIGTPTNLVFSAVVKQIYNYEITFSKWMLFGFPVSILILGICWFYLVRIAFPMKDSGIAGGLEEIDEQLKQLGKMTSAEKRVLGVFCLTAFAWITRSFLWVKFIPGINDTVIAIGGATLLFLIPSKSEEEKNLMNWETAVKLPWGIILLFGGGLSIASGFKASGLAEWIGNQMGIFQHIPFILILGVLVISVNFLTEITSNTATASIILPILAGFALAINVHPFSLMIGATVAASCAFMLPVATPPNAVIFGSGYVTMGDMVRTGVWMNLLSTIILTLIVYFLLPLIWGLDLHVFPMNFR